MRFAIIEAFLLSIDGSFDESASRSNSSGSASIGIWVGSLKRTRPRGFENGCVSNDVIGPLAVGVVSPSLTSVSV